MQIVLFILVFALSGQSLAEEIGCSASARSLHLACGFDVREENFIRQAGCINTNDAAAADNCLVAVAEEREEEVEECGDIFAARLELCESLDDAAHEVDFGEDFAENFVDPRDIGGTVEPNPWFPLVAGNNWVYEGISVDEDDGEVVTETVTVTVTDKVKLIQGILCVVVQDTAEEDGEIIESTDDWFAQDVDGNVWYCGEISQNFEFFEGDEPEEAELVDIDGSWKSGRDDAKAGLLLPFAPEVGQIFRQELLFTDAEDAVEILSLEGTESSPVASCNSSCLVTKDFTPLEPDVEENKYYLSGIGLIVEIDLESGERVELIEFTLN